MLNYFWVGKFLHWLISQCSKNIGFNCRDFFEVVMQPQHGQSRWNKIGSIRELYWLSQMWSVSALHFWLWFPSECGFPQYRQCPWYGHQSIPYCSSPDLMMKTFRCLGSFLVASCIMGIHELSTCNKNLYVLHDESISWALTVRTCMCSMTLYGANRHILIKEATYLWGSLICLSFTNVL